MNREINTEVALIPEQALAEHYAQVVSLQAEQARLWRRAFRTSRTREFIGYALCIAEAVAIISMMPLEKVMNTFVYLDKFGMANTSAHLISELPTDHRIAGIDAILWQYTRLREHYVGSEADADYKIVSAMSSETVRTQYQSWVNPKLNPKSAPGIQLGQHGYIKLFRENGGSAWIAHDDDYLKGVYQISFCRLIVADGKPATAEKMVATLDYNVVDETPSWLRLEVDYAGVVITSYPGPESVGTGVKLVPNVGSDNPCDR